MRLEGVHHVTAITGDVLKNVDFYTRVLGLRLVGKSVNQDDPSVYHVFFSDEHGRPGADITFFEYRGAPRGRAGSGMVHRVVWRVTGEPALAFWEARLAKERVATRRDGGSLRFADPEGLEHELVMAHVPDEPRIADHPEIPREVAPPGFHGRRADGPRQRRRPRLRVAVQGGGWGGRVGAARSDWARRGARGDFRAPAPCTTWRGARASRSIRAGWTRSRARASTRRRSWTVTSSSRSTSASRAACCSRS